MASDQFSEGDLCVWSTNVSTTKYGAKPVAVFRIHEVDDENQKLHGGILWTNDDRLDDEIHAPMVHTEVIE